MKAAVLLPTLPISALMHMLPSHDPYNDFPINESGFLAHYSKISILLPKFLSSYDIVNSNYVHALVTRLFLTNLQGAASRPSLTKGFGCSSS
jgi:hypothetical protein